MIEIGVRANSKNHVWSFPGDDEALVAAFRAGRFPLHLFSRGEAPPEGLLGELREIPRAPMLDRLLQLEGDEYVLLILDDEHRWRPDGARTARAEDDHERSSPRPDGRASERRAALDALPEGPPGPERLDLSDLRLTEGEWADVGRRVRSWSGLRSVELGGASIDARQLEALLAAAPAGCAIARRVNADGSAVELYQDWCDWGMLWDLVAPVFRQWTGDLATLADHLGAPAVAADARTLAGSWPAHARDPDTLAQRLFGRTRGSLLPALRAAAASVPALAGHLEEASREVDALWDGCFEGAMGNDFPFAVADWINRVPALAGALRCWRGDGADAPVWDPDTAARIAGWHDASWRRWVDGEGEE